jgi:hypothetical protein
MIFYYFFTILGTGLIIFSFLPPISEEMIVFGLFFILISVGFIDVIRRIEDVQRINDGE